MEFVWIRIHHPGSGSADPDPHPQQNDTDPKHWLFMFYKCTQLIWSLHWEGKMNLLFENFFLLFAKISHFFFKQPKLKVTNRIKVEFQDFPFMTWDSLTFLHVFYVPKLSCSVSDPYLFDADPDLRIRFQDDGSGSGSNKFQFFSS